MAYFFDTSAVVKRYMTEKGSGWVDRTLEKESPIWISKITLAEIYSVVGRRIRENTYPIDDLSLFRKMFERHLGRNYRLVQVTNEVITLSQHLLLKHPLRALDSLQLASALITHKRTDQLNTPLIFVCADVRLLTVTEAEGLVPLNPNDHA
ncbi:MAG: type II toxin-antitoxin system VapC family toxin [Anaerolineae bacterium]|jgi:hypothetical protein|nr:type II toxin-antitoxin system VapC family toxin [Anaerolineae bacterium]